MKSRNTTRGAVWSLTAALLAAGLASPAAATTGPPDPGGDAPYLVDQDSLLHLTDGGAYSLELVAGDDVEWAVGEGDDVTSWFVGADGAAVFTNDGGVASARLEDDAARLVVELDAARIEGFATNGPGDLYLLPPAGAFEAADDPALEPVHVGEYVVPAITVASDIHGSAYTYGKSTLKEHLGSAVEYDPNGAATLKLSLDGLDDALIDSSGARVELTDGDGYYPGEYVLSATTLTGAWSGGETDYALERDDLEIDTGDYLITDTNSGREWSALGGDGHGNYLFQLSVSGISYDGLPVAPQTFPVRVSVFGYDYTSDAVALYGDGPSVTADIAPLAAKVDSPPVAGGEPVWTWVGDGDVPNLTDELADDFYITWPIGADASVLTAADVTITLHSEHGADLVLTPQDYRVASSAGETQIAVTLLYWPFAPVYTTLTIDVDTTVVDGFDEELSTAHDIVSVYVYEAQQGGGGITVDGTVTAFSFYGLENLTSADQVLSPVTYVLSTTVDGQTRYLGQQTPGADSLVGDPAEATVFDGAGPQDRNVRLIGTTAYITTRLNQTVAREVGGETHVFTKVYSGGSLIPPADADQDLRAEPGYVIPWGTGNWITHEKWAWQPAIAQGWVGIDVQPFTGRYSWNVARGGTQQFTATDDPSVIWSIQGTVSQGTTISETGLLTIAPEETSPTFAVHARSTTDTSERGQGAVNVNVVPASATVDTAELEHLLELYAEVEARDYTASSHAAFATAYATAAALLDSDGLSQEEVDAAAQDLATAGAALRRAVVSVTAGLSRDVYAVGEDLDPASITVTARLSDASTRILGAGEYRLSGHDPQAVGVQTLVVEVDASLLAADAEPVTTTVTVTVVAASEGPTESASPTESESPTGGLPDTGVGGVVTWLLLSAVALVAGGGAVAGARRGRAMRL